MSIAAYKRTITETESPRQIERRLFSEITASLENLGEEFDVAGARKDKLSILASGLRDTLWRNSRLWMSLRNDLAEPGNALSPELRASLISLALWVDSHTRNVLRGDSNVRPLIDVNNSIIRGLSGNSLTAVE